jgi:hypothetical protein
VKSTIFRKGATKTDGHKVIHVSGQGHLTPSYLSRSSNFTQGRSRLFKVKLEVSKKYYIQKEVQQKLIMPNIGIMQITSQFGPVDNAYNHKNHLGQIMVGFLQN